MDKLIKIFATALGAGYSPVAPGTAGTLVGVLLFWPMSSLSLVHYLAFLAVFVLLASWVSDRAQVLFGKKDPQSVAIDEVAGFLVAMAGHGWDWKTVVAGFVLFRIFDVWKPFPIRKIESCLSNGFGVVLDDVLAGVYANVCLTVLAGYFL